MKEYRLDSIVTIGAEQNTFGRMAELYAAADICVLPSLREGLGLSLLEAMATHVPVITTNTVGVTEIVKDKHNGLVIPVSNPQALAEAITTLIRDPGQCKRLAAAAVDFIEQQGFTYQAMALSHMAFYREILADAKATHVSAGE